MKRIKLVKKVRSEISESRQSILRTYRRLKKVGQASKSVLFRPANVFYGVSASIISVLLGVWFANIGMIQAVFNSQNINTQDKFEFLFTMLGTLSRNMESLQIILIVLHAILWCFVAAFWLEAIKLQNEKPHSKETSVPLILVTLCIGASAILAISLVTPVLTRGGISVFVSDHFSGTLLLIFVLVADFSILKRFARLFARLYPGYY